MEQDDELHGMKEAWNVEELEDLKVEARVGPVFVRCGSDLHKDAVSCSSLSIASNRAIVTIHYHANKVNGVIDHSSWECCDSGIADRVLFSSLSKDNIGWIPIGVGWAVMGLDTSTISDISPSNFRHGEENVIYEEEMKCVIVYNSIYIGNYPCESIFRAILRGDGASIKSLVGTGLITLNWNSTDSSSDDSDSGGAYTDIEWDAERYSDTPMPT